MTRYLWIIALVLAVLAAPAAAQNFPCPVPWTFTNGSGGSFQPDANQVNQNFAAIEACLLPATPGSLGIVQPDGVTITVNGQGVISAGLVGDSVLNNSDLMLAKTTSFPNGVFRIAYSGAPSAPTSTPLFYLPSSSPCVLGAGAGDGGSQVKSADNLCWIAPIPAGQAYIEWWGLTPNPINTYISKTGNDSANFCVIQASPCLTITQATNACFKFNVEGGNCIVNALPGGSNEWDENVFVNGRLPGAGNTCVNPNLSQPISDCGQVVFNGNGTEVWNGGGDCGTLVVSDFGVVSVQNMANLEGTGSSCSSTIFVQLGGDVNLYAGNTYGPATIGIFHNENSGSHINSWKTQTLAGNATYLVSGGSTADFQVGVGSLAFSGTPTFNTLFFGESNAVFQINPTNVFSGAANTSDEYQLKTGAVFNIYQTQSPLWPGGGGTGFLYSGGRIYSPSTGVYNMPCIASNGGCPLASPAPTGLGGGSISVVAGSGPYSGQLDLLTGASPAATGTFYVSFPSVLVSDTGLLGPCTVALSIGGPTPGIWQTYSYVRMADTSIGPPSHIGVLWANGNPTSPQNLTANSDYLINYTCNNN
jgi:hypothetical protein